MKTKLLGGAILWLAGSLLAADSTPLGDVTNAVNALAGSPNYSWKSTVVVPAGSQFKPGPTNGKTEKDGYTDVSLSMRGDTIEFFTKGDQAAVNSPDNGWQSVADLDADEGPGRFLAMTVHSFKLPAAQAADLAMSAPELAKTNGIYAGDLTEAAAESFLSFRPRGGGAAPEISEAKGSVQFWLKDGTLAKYEFKVAGKVSFNGSDREVNRDTTVEITDVATTKVTVPDDARKILSPKPVDLAK